MKRSLRLYIGLDNISFPHINRSIDVNELENVLRAFFPLIHDSYKRGNGLALRIIKYLGEYGNATIYRLSKQCGATEPATINIVRRMEQRGYLKHITMKGKGPKGSYIYRLTKLGELTYYTIFHHKPASWIIDIMLGNIEDKTIKDTPLSRLVRKNEALLKDNIFRELLDYLFIKYVKFSIVKSLEDLFIVNQREMYIPIQILFIGFITPVVVSVTIDVLSTLSSYNDVHSTIVFATILTELDRLSLIPIGTSKIEQLSLPDFVEEIRAILNEVDISTLGYIASLAIDYLKYLIIEMNWIIIKGALNTLVWMKQLSGSPPSENVLLELRNLINRTQEFLDNILEKIDRL